MPKAQRERRERTDNYHLILQWCHTPEQRQSLKLSELVKLGRQQPDPTLRREDTAGDALWNLAQRFEAEHKPDAARETLHYLVDTYPSNRHVGEAKESLKRLGAATAVDGG